MTLRVIAALVGLAVFSGCATTPVSLPAKITAPDSWRTPPAKLILETGNESGNEGPEWWKSFADPELDKLIVLALAENADLRIASARIQQARALAAGAMAEQRPSLDSSLEARREPVPAVRAKDSNGFTTLIPPYRRNPFSIQIVEATYELDLLGRLALAVQTSGAELLATEAELRAVRLWVAHEVVAAYADTRFAEAQLPWANQQIELATQLLAAERRKREAGLSTLANVRAVEDELSGAHETLANFERSRNLGLVRLALVLGKAPSEVSWIPVDVYFAQFPNAGGIDADLPAAVLDRRPDVDAAWHRVVASTTEAERARLEKYPKLTLTGSAGFLSETLRRGLTGDALAWAIGATLQGPLLDGGRVKARTDAASAIATQRQMEYRKVVLQALNEVETALTETVHAQERLRITESSVRRRVADTTAASVRLRQGAGDRTTLIRAELARIEAHQGATARRHDLILAWASLQKTLGR